MPTAAPTPSPSLEAALGRLGFDAFRPSQREAIETLLSRRRLLYVAPTGGGKSLVYQLPATLLSGTTLVVSPLIALMQDQVAALEARGIAATYLASTLDGEELRHRWRRARRGDYRLVYVAPERLASTAFEDLLASIRCPLVAIDEAHCISEWGHDFRPEYLEIGRLVDKLPEARVLACTATATPVVRDEIVARLGLGPDTPQLVRGFARPNLILRAAEVRTGAERRRHVDTLLAEALGHRVRPEGTAIVYAPTRKTAEREGMRLENAGYRAAFYHAGLSGDEREQVARQFAEGALSVIVATNAFGMGIDRADVRAVIHLAPPGSVEAYYQEVGRAGRDGKPAFGLMLTGGEDMALRRHLLEAPNDSGPPDPAVIEHKWNLFLELMRWAEGGSCRHDAILRYFGDREEELGGCGRCDVCVAIDSEGATDEETEIVVRKALSGVARTHGRFGLGATVKLLKGASDPRLTRAGLEEVRTFGILSDRHEDWIWRLLRRCITAGWIGFGGGQRPVNVLTEAGQAVMMAKMPARLLLPSGQHPKARARTGDRPAQPTAPEAALDTAASALFEQLRAHRLDVARAQGVPPYVVASDRTLRDLAQLRPRDRDQLLLAHGMGPTKAARYGEGLLEVIRSATR